MSKQPRVISVDELLEKFISKAVKKEVENQFGDVEEFIEDEIYEKTLSREDLKEIGKIDELHKRYHELIKEIKALELKASAIIVNLENSINDNKANNKQ